MIRMVVCICLIFISLISSGGTIDPNTSDSKYTKYGQQFNYVGSLCGSYENKDLFCASAVAIDDHHILTAAHVVDGAEICIFSLDELPYKIQTIIIHEDFGKKKHILDYSRSDIAICYSEKSFNLKFYPSLYENSDEELKLACIAGCGFTGDFIKGATRYDGIKRAGSNFIDSVRNDNLLICSASKRSDNNFTSLEFLIASGDSGGGLFIDNKLAGINSCVIAIGNIPKSKYGEESGHTRVSKFIEWIEKNKIYRKNNY